MPLSIEYLVNEAPKTFSSSGDCLRSWMTFAAHPTNQSGFSFAIASERGCSLCWPRVIHTRCVILPTTRRRRLVPTALRLRNQSSLWSISGSVDITGRSRRNALLQWSRRLLWRANSSRMAGDPLQYTGRRNDVYTETGNPAPPERLCRI